jgi:hypothetical protein
LGCAAMVVKTDDFFLRNQNMSCSLNFLSP